MSNKVFLDANILLEIIHERENFSEAVSFVRQYAGQLHVSALTVHLVMYFGQKVANQDALRQLLSDYRILSITPAHIDWAFDNIRGKDFEDALQVACALAADCNHFATFDHALAKRYRDETKLTFITPG